MLSNLGSSTEDIVVGAQVCMRSSPMYHVGATAFTVRNGVPKVGTLMEAAWSLNDVCRFQIKPPGGPSTPPETRSGSTDRSGSNDRRWVLRVQCG